MPELPEVETMVSRLQDFVGKKIMTVAVDGGMSDKASLRYLPGDEVEQALFQRINGIFRRGKFIVFMLDSGALLCHNAMSGYWDVDDKPWTYDYVEGKRTATSDDVRVWIVLDSTTTLRFHDARMFGSLHFLDPQRLASKLSELGPEADTTAHMYEPCEVMNEDSFTKMLDSKLPVKQLLTDQHRIAGIGNIYVVEACWSARVNPLRPGNSLTEGERQALWMSIHMVLRTALARKLDYSKLAIYRREKCLTCNAKIMVEDFKGRTTYWCATCQK